MTWLQLAVSLDLGALIGGVLCTLVAWLLDRKITERLEKLEDRVLKLETSTSSSQPKRKR